MVRFQNNTKKYENQTKKLQLTLPNNMGFKNILLVNATEFVGHNGSDVMVRNY